MIEETLRAIRCQDAYYWQTHLARRHDGASRNSRGDLYVIIPSLTAVWRGAMLAVGLAALVPAAAGDVRSHPNAARDYADAVARATRWIAGDDSVVADGGATMLRVHGARTPRAIVLVHGFTDSPRQFAELADSLYASGDNVLVPRLPHHALRSRNVGELARLTAAELCRTGDGAVDVAAGLGDSVVVLGLSVGGTLALWAGEHRAEVRRVVVIAPPFEVTHVPSILERPLVNLGAHVPNLTRRSPSDSARPDRDPGFATRGLAQILRLGMAVRRDVARSPRYDVETLFLVNAHDRTVKTDAVLDIARAIRGGGAPVAVYEFPDSAALPHNVVDPIDRPARPAPSLPVLPVLVALAHGANPPRWITIRR